MSSTNRCTPKPKKKRRAFGRVCQRANGRGWYAQFPDPSGAKTANNRARYVTRSVSSKREGEELLREVRRAMIRGQYAQSETRPSLNGMTVVGSLDQYLDAKRAEGRAPKTIGRYVSSRNAVAASPLGQIAVVDVRPQHIEEFIAWRRERLWHAQRRDGAKCDEPVVVKVKKGAAPSNSTVNRDLQIVSQAFNRLIRLRQLDENPVARVSKPRERNQKRAVLSKKEVGRLLDACSDSLRPLALAALLTGARSGELIRLNWADISFARKAISLYRPKTGTVAELPLHTMLAAELKRIKKARRPADGDPVFLSERGTRYRYYRRAWNSALKRAGLAERTGLVFHSLRHSFATAYLQNGAVTDLQELLGHSSLNTTQIYSAMVNKRARASLEALEFGSAVAFANE